MKHRWIAMMMIVAPLAGCQTSVQDEKLQANQRWQHTRAEVLCGAGAELLKCGQLDNAADKALEALALDGDLVQARLLLGKVYIEQGQYALAVGELGKAAQKLPQSSEAAYLLAVAQEKAGQLEDALAGYRRAYALNPASLAPVVAATEVLVLLGKTAEARVYIDNYIPQAGADPAVFEVAGRIAMMENDYDDAAQSFQQALDLDSRNLRYREALGRAQFHAARFADALETFKTLTGAAGYTIPAWVHTMMGDCFMSAGRLREARDSYQAACELQPESAGASLNLAKAALALGDATRAIVAAQQALTLDPANRDAAATLGYAFVRDGQIARAISVLSAAVADNPEYALLRCVLGRAYAASGNEAQAARCYTAALQYEPQNPLARELLIGRGNSKPASAP